MRLNIVGNGFDLYHGLPCKYYYFGCFLAKNYYHFYEEMSKMYNFTYCKLVGYEEVETYVDDIFWKTFEERLGVLDPTWMEGSLMDDLGLENDDPVDIEMPEESNSERIKEKFCEWIRVTVDLTENYKTIKSKIGKEKLKLSKRDYYVNFNYTKTLEEIYKIPESHVFHIHGLCDDERGSNLIIGHGNDEAIRWLDERINEIKNETYYLAEQSERNRLNEYKCEQLILSDLRKNVESLIEDLRYELDYAKINVDEIYVWGLSCGEVDRPYIKFLQEKYPSAKWKFSYYTIEEIAAREKLVEKLGLENVEYFELNNPNAEEICQDLVLQNGIEEL